MYPSNKKKKVWREEKERLLKMTLEERRKEYLRDYVPLSTILSWKEEMKSKGQNDEENTQETPQMKKSLSEKVSLYRGDITLLEVDAIVNAVCGSAGIKAKASCVLNTEVYHSALALITLSAQQFFLKHNSPGVIVWTLCDHLASSQEFDVLCLSIPLLN
ncbi:ADP-ribose glycohydrolase MACROD2 isoform X7 [Meriones unguiculatus]|uniref:ADP-ribose glycohydrolase MACROD2 isoform X7 n=1 Tax=Meriones unguiculatus TaxID=10047 RepID=UPI00293F26F5|nr:ADP-ribose glycohydrolase MACROD2 isoform X7 [Meriones unguiculatus]